MNLVGYGTLFYGINRVIKSGIMRTFMLARGALTHG